MTNLVQIKFTPQIILALAVLILGVGFGLGKYVGGRSLEGFTSKEGFVLPVCASCKQQESTCNCNPKGIARLVCPPCREPDMSKYVLKSSIPPCPTCPDMSNYMLKTECPPTPDLSKYVLKSSIPKQQPVIIDNSACKKDAGECPPCPRPRCPIQKCPTCPSCPTPAPCPRAVCPETKVKCKAETDTASTVRPFLAPLHFGTFGSGM